MSGLVSILRVCGPGLQSQCQRPRGRRILNSRPAWDIQANQKTESRKPGHPRPKVALIFLSIEITHGAYKSVCSILTSLSQAMSKRSFLTGFHLLPVLGLATLNSKNGNHVWVPMLRTSVLKLDSCSYLVLPTAMEATLGLGLPEATGR